MANDDKSTPDDATGLSGFQRDALFAIATLEAPNGLEVKRKLEAYYGSDENHGRLYPNLDNLVDWGFVEKTEADGRTNAYHLTDDGWRALEAHREWEANCLGQRSEHIGLTSDSHDLLLNYQREGEDLSETLHRVLSVVPNPTRLPDGTAAETVERDEFVIVRARDEDDYLDTFTFGSAYDVHRDIKRSMEVPADD